MNEELKIKALGALKDLMEEFPDSLDIGTPATGGAIKVYHRAEDLEGFKLKIDNMLAAREYAQAKIGFVPKVTK